MALCIHGFEPGQCLICQTLGPATADRSGSRRPTRTKRRADSGRTKVSAGAVEVVDDRRGALRSRPVTHILIAVVMVVIAIAAFWIVAGIVFALLRLLEIVAVGVIAGVLGYRLGRARGHRDR